MAKKEGTTKAKGPTLPALKLPPQLYEPFMAECADRNMQPEALLSQLIWQLVEERKQRHSVNWKAVTMEMARELRESDPRAARRLAALLEADEDDE